MESHVRIPFWLKGERTQNFGDSLTKFLVDQLFLVFDEDAEVRIIGSVIDDGMVPERWPFTQSGTDPNKIRVVYWGCGVRRPGGFTDVNHPKVQTLAVRGPLTASELRLGSDIPIGDPGLLMPALHAPHPHEVFDGKSVCIPHFCDKRSDAELLALGGADLILRPNIGDSEQDLLRTVDAIVAADFVLTAALHGAIIAAAYGRPFAFWDNGHLDLPFKWEDFAASASFPLKLASTVAEGRSLYEQFAPQIRLPPLLPLLASAPFQLKPAGLLKVLRHELNRPGTHAPGEIERWVRLFSDRASHFDQLARQTLDHGRIALRASEQAAAVERELRDLLEQARTETGTAAAACSTLQAELDARTAELAEAERTLASLRTDLAQTHATTQDLQRQCAQTQAAVNATEEARAALARSLVAQTASLQSALSNLAQEFAARTALAAERAQFLEQIETTQRELQAATKNAARHEADVATLRTKLSEQAEKMQRELKAAAKNAARHEADRTTLRAQLDALSAELENVRIEKDRRVTGLRKEVGLAQSNGQRALARAARLEREMVRRTRTTLSEAAPRRFRIGRAIGLAPPLPDRAIHRETRIITGFVERFEWFRLMAPGPDNRTDRIVQFLLGSADVLPDMPLFDTAAYLDMYPRVAAEGINPLVHFIENAAKDRLNIHPLMHTGWYNDRYPDTTALEMQPAVHYVNFGAGMGYDPHPLFDTRFYLTRYPDVAAASLNPLAHYLKFPGCNPHPLFDTDYYLRNNPEVAAAGINPLVHYLSEGARAGYDPHPLFSSRFYLDTYKDIAAAGINPLVHYLWHGAAEGREPHPDFASRAYLASHPELAEAGINPLVHFVSTGGTAPAAPAPAISTARTQVSTPTPRIAFMVDACYPRPDRDSGSLDQISFVRIFQALGYQVHFAADIELGVETPYRDSLAAIGVHCVTYPDYVSVEDFLERNTASIALCFLSRVHFGARHIEAIRRLCPGTPVIFNTVDLHHVREQREAELKGDPDALAYAAETRDLELARVAEADATIVVSEQEAELLRKEAPQARVHMVPLIREYAVARETPFAARAGIAFVGSFQHMPNVDAVTHFLDDIWPLVHQTLTGTEFFVIGADLPESLAARAEPGITFVGHVPELEPWLNRVKMTVAPLRYGAGAKGKVVSSLAHGVPCVASPIAAEGMGLVDGQDILVGRTPQEFAQRIVSLYNDERRWTELSDAGMAVIRARYSLDHGIDLVRSLLGTIGTSAPR